MIQTYLPWWQILLFALLIPGLFELTKDYKFDRWIGELSYPLYILHFPILQLLKKGTLSPLNDTISLGSQVALFSFIGAILIYLFVDKPLEKRFKAEPKISNSKARTVGISKKYPEKLLLIACYAPPIFLLLYLS
jgi:peptidoglycan/LPS O-acetylase OafA/YrhL